MLLKSDRPDFAYLLENDVGKNETSIGNPSNKTIRFKPVNISLNKESGELQGFDPI